MKVFLTVFFLPITLVSQTTVLFDNISLPIKDKIITCVKTDKKGNNWIGTLDGLFCYNGTNWINITIKNSKLPSNTILCIEITEEKKYIGTTQGLLIIDKVFSLQIAEIISAFWKLFNLDFTTSKKQKLFPQFVD